MSAHSARVVKQLDVGDQPCVAADKNLVITFHDELAAVLESGSRLRGEIYPGSCGARSVVRPRDQRCLPGRASAQVARERTDIAARPAELQKSTEISFLTLGLTFPDRLLQHAVESLAHRRQASVEAFHFPIHPPVPGREPPRPFVFTQRPASPRFGD